MTLKPRASSPSLSRPVANLAPHGRIGEWGAVPEEVGADVQALGQDPDLAWAVEAATNPHGESRGGSNANPVKGAQGKGIGCLVAAFPPLRPLAPTLARPSAFP
jgi:hypothetical protein